MSDILKILDNLRDNLWNRYGNPFASYKQTQDDVHMTYYVGRLMEELGHKWISPSRIKGDREDRAYFSEKALHDAFLAGRLIERKANSDMRKNIIAELRGELHHAIDNIEI
jgi:hypothetical protein